MKNRFVVTMTLCILVALLSSSFALATGDPMPAVRGPMPIAGEPVIVRVYYPDLDMGNKVLLAFEPWLLETNYEAGYHVMQVTQEEIDRLRALGLRVEQDSKWVASNVGPALTAEVESIPSYPCYRTVEETFAAAQALVTAHPDLATWIDVGNSWQKTVNQGGYDMMVLKLTNSSIPGPKPKLFITAAIHAREYATAELVTRFAEYLVNNYGIDADATWILDHHEVHLMLQTNPDGRKMAETGLSWRKNTNSNYCWLSSYRGADLNRNFAFQWACCGGSSSSECNETYHGPSPASEPETQAVQAYLDTIFPDQRGPNLTDPAPSDATGVYIDVHAYGQLVLWPWGFTSGTAPNATALQTLGRKYAYYNSHTPQQAYALYATDGTTDDHAYGNLGVAAYCFEVGTAFFQACSYFESTLLPANMPALIYAAKVVRTPYLTPAGPDTLNLALSSSEVPAGTPVTLNATINDTRYNNTNGTEPTQDIAVAEYYVDTPPWDAGATAHTMSASDGSFDAKTEGVTATLDTTGWGTDRHIVFVRGQDAGGNWGAFSAVFLTIAGPANQPPTADPQSLVTAEDSALAATLTGSDPEGDPLTFAVQSGPSHGTLSGAAPALTYTPAANYNGADSFTFVANDGQANSAPATVSITITPVNDTPVAHPQSLETGQETPLDITLTGSDVDGDTLTFAVQGVPSHGTLTGTAPDLAYTPAAGYTGDDGFSFTVSDGTATSTQATVSIAVTPVNHRPVAYSGTTTTDEDAPVAITLTGYDPDGNLLTYSVTTSPSHGTLSGTAPDLTYTPATNYYGPDSFAFVVNDGQVNSEPATISITVLPVNDAPVANPQSVMAQQDTPLAITLTGSDVEGSPLTFQVVNGPSHGSLSGTAPNLTYTPNAGYAGDDSFGFRASDGELDSNVATVSILVNASGEDVAAADYATTYGSVAGTYVATQAQDGTVQAITEVHSGGKPSARYDQLEHVWRFDLTGGNHVFHVDAYYQDAGDTDSGFDFSWSPSPTGPWINLVTVDKTADDNGYQVADLGTVPGTIYIRVVDNNRTPGQNSNDTLYVDHMYIDGGIPPTEPPGPATNPEPADGATDVTTTPALGWTAGAGAASHDVYFGTNPVLGSQQFQGNQAGDSFSPGTLGPNTTYYWRIDEVNSVGTTTGSVWSFTTRSAQEQPTVYVYSIDMSGKTAGANRFATAVITVHDSPGNPVAGATVYGTWSDEYAATVNGVTGADGTVSFTTGNVKLSNATFTFTVDDIVLAGYIYDPNLNVETSETIVVP